MNFACGEEYQKRIGEQLDENLWVKDRSSLSTPQKNPTPRVTGEWGWKDGWFSEAGLLAATEDQSKSAKAEKGGGGGLGDGARVQPHVINDRLGSA